jgi:hypothetical protein
MSPGWQFRTRQMASKVENRMAFALPLFRIDKFAMVMPTRSDKVVSDIFRFASITSRFMIMAIYITNSASRFSFTPSL